MTKILISSVMTVVLLTACSNNKITPLPQGGPTSAQIIQGEGGQVNQAQGYTAQDGGYMRITLPDSMSSLTTQRLRDLNEDFKRVPNPQILGYVAPHFNQSNMPVPGYFTVFRLYKKDSYALLREDAATGLSEVAQ